MSGNSNPSINSPASTNHELDTLVGEDAQFAANILQEFNDHQACHISVSSTNSSVQYVPHSPTPSIQEVSSPPPLRVRITAGGVGHYPPISPGSAETLLCMEDNDLTDTTRAVAHSLLPPEQAAELLPWYMQWSRDLAGEMHRRRLVRDKARRADTLPSSYHPCDCTTDWRCEPHETCFIHDSCFCPGSGSF